MKSLRTLRELVTNSLWTLCECFVNSSWTLSKLFANSLWNFLWNVANSLRNDMFLVAVAVLQDDERCFPCSCWVSPDSLEFSRSSSRWILDESSTSWLGCPGFRLLSSSYCIACELLQEPTQSMPPHFVTLPGAALSTGVAAHVCKELGRVCFTRRFESSQCKSFVLDSC